MSAIFRAMSTDFSQSAPLHAFTPAELAALPEAERLAILQMESLVRRAHSGQFRRDGVTPYIQHIREVAKRAPKTVEYQLVALGHDLVEDTGVTFKELKDLLPLHNSVLSGIQTLTKREDETYEVFIGWIALNDGGHWIPVKVADILANLSDGPTKKQIRKYAKALLELTE